MSAKRFNAPPCTVVRQPNIVAAATPNHSEWLRERTRLATSAVGGQLYEYGPREFNGRPGPETPPRRDAGDIIAQRRMQILRAANASYAVAMATPTETSNTKPVKRSLCWRITPS